MAVEAQVDEIDNSETDSESKHSDNGESKDDHSLEREIVNTQEAINVFILSVLVKHEKNETEFGIQHTSL